MNEKLVDLLAHSFDSDNPEWLRSVVDDLVNEVHRLESEVRSLRYYNELLSADKEYDV